MAQLSAWHMANSTNKEVQRNNHFEVEIANVGVEVLTLAVNSTNLPTITVPQTELHHGNSVVKVAGKVEYDDITLEVKDFVGDDVEKILYDWFSEVYDPATDTVGMAADYKRDGTLLQYSPDESIVREWDVYGVWPTSFESGDMNYEDSEPKVISLTLSIDRAIRV